MATASGDFLWRGDVLSAGEHFILLLIKIKNYFSRSTIIRRPLFGC
jgi:hypothetical protein